MTFETLELTGLFLCKLMVKTDMYNIVYSVGKKKSGPARQADATIVEFHLLQGFLICVATNKRTITPQVKSWRGNSGLLVKAGFTHCATAATKCIVWIGGNVQVRDALNDISQGVHLVQLHKGQISMVASLEAHCCILWALCHRFIPHGWIIQMCTRLVLCVC